MRTVRLALVALTGFFALTLSAQANPHARIDRGYRRRNAHIERVTDVRHRRTPWYRVDKHVKITLDAVKLKRANKRITDRAHQKVDRRQVRQRRGNDRWDRWKVGFGLGLSKWH